MKLYQVFAILLSVLSSQQVNRITAIRLQVSGKGKTEITSWIICILKLLNEKEIKAM